MLRTILKISSPGSLYVTRATIASAKDVPFRKEYFPFVNGKEIAPTDIDKAQRLDLRSPASRDYLTQVICATEQQTNSAIDLSNDVFENGVWSRADARVRAKVLNNIAEELRKALPDLVPMEVAQTGRAIKEMKAQVTYSCSDRFPTSMKDLYYFLYILILLYRWPAFQNGSNIFLLLSVRRKVQCPPFSATTSIMYGVFRWECVVC